MLTQFNNNETLVASTQIKSNQKMGDIVEGLVIGHAFGILGVYNSEG